MEIVNVALDLCRRTSGLSPAQLQKNGLNIDNVDNEGAGKDSTTKSSSSPSTTVAQMDEDQMMEVFPEEDFVYDEQTDIFYEMPEEEAEEPGLTSQEVDSVSNWSQSKKQPCGKESQLRRKRLK